MGRNTRMQQYINYRIRVTIDDSRTIVGTFTAFDRYMNLVIADAEEFRTVKAEQVKRPLGFVLVRGDSVVGITAEAAPSAAEGPAATVL